MKWAFASGLTLVFLATTNVRAADSYESLKKEWIATANEIGDALKKIKDESTAKEGGPKLKKLKAKLDDINSRQGKLGRVDLTEIGEVEKKYMKDFEAALQRWLKEETRVQKVKGGPEALKELK
jgi:hypothetical protein